MRILPSGWRVVIGSTIALTVSNGPILLFTFGVFLQPVSQEFGWPRGAMSLGLTAGLILGGLATPLLGSLIDRWGIQRITLISITLFAGSFALLSQTPQNIVVFGAMYAAAGLLSCGQAPLPFAKAISACFEERRGLALGIAMAGIGIGIAAAPLAARALLTVFGWRHAYALLGAASWLIAFPAVLFLVKDPETTRIVAGAATTKVQAGEAVSYVVRGKEFWLIATATFLVVMTINGIVAHLQALAIDRGVPAGAAARLLAAMGLATILGRLLSGYLLDRLFAPYVAAATFLVPLIGVSVLWSGTSTFSYLVCTAVCFGLSLGAEVDIIGFLIGRYFGLRSYGQVYGYVFAAFTIGSGLGPFLMGLSFDRTGNYMASLAAFSGALVLAAWLISRLGEYRFSGHSTMVSAGPTARGDVEPVLD